MTIQQLTSNQPAVDISREHDTGVPISEAVLTQLAAEFFSSLPKQNAQGLNLDLPEYGIAHQPQTKDPIAALSGRIPAVVQQTSLSPDAARHYVDPTLDHPERRAISSAPIIGGASNPDPSSLLNRIHLPSNVNEVPSITPSTGSFPTQNLITEQHSFYFLDISQPELSNTSVPHTDVLRNPYAFDSYHVTDDHQLKGLLQDRNDKPATAESAYYFIQSPQIENARHHTDLQIPLTQQNYQPLNY